jgi:hypothetical protein
LAASHEVKDVSYALTDQYKRSSVVAFGLSWQLLLNVGGSSTPNGSLRIQIQHGWLVIQNYYLIALIILEITN